jgi:hypothetical protein
MRDALLAMEQTSKVLGVGREQIWIAELLGMFYNDP